MYMQADMETDTQVGRQADNDAVNNFTWLLSESLNSRVAHLVSVTLIVTLRKSLTNEVQSFKAAIFANDSF